MIKFGEFEFEFGSNDLQLGSGGEEIQNKLTTKWG